MPNDEEMEILKCRKRKICSNKEYIYCGKCGKANYKGSSFCGYCGNLFSALVENDKEISKEEIDLAYYKVNLILQQQELEEARKQTEQQRMQLEIQMKEYENQMKCPSCGSTSLSGNKKGYSIIKGAIGAAIFGIWGLPAGNIGAKKIKVTCIKCGYEFEVEKKRED